MAKGLRPITGTNANPLFSMNQDVAKQEVGDKEFMNNTDVLKIEALDTKNNDHTNEPTTDNKPVETVKAESVETENKLQIIPEQNLVQTIITSVLPALQEPSINEYVKQKLIIIEKMIKKEKGSSFSKKKSIPRKRLYERNSVISISLMTELVNLINELDAISDTPKYKIIEMIIVNGLKNTNFDEELGEE